MPLSELTVVLVNGKPHDFVLIRDMVFGNLNGMKTVIPIDKAGRVVLPKEIRQRFHLLSGDKLSLELISDGVILHASIARPSLSEKNGLLVHEGEAAGDLLGAVDLDRANRNHDLLEMGR